MTEEHTQEQLEELEKGLALRVIYNRLAAVMDEKAVERTKKNDTGRGYDTTGYGYQYVVDRFNEVMGLGKWGWKYEVLRAEPCKWGNGRPYHDITVELRIWLLVDDRQFSHTCVGGHQANPHADALKGAITNAFKKTAAFFGVGAEAYRGTIDDDNKGPVSGDGGPVPKPNAVEYKTVEAFRERIAHIQNAPEAHKWMKKHQGEIDALSKPDRVEVMKAYMKRLSALKGAARDGGSK